MIHEPKVEDHRKRNPHYCNCYSVPPAVYPEIPTDKFDGSEPDEEQVQTKLRLHTGASASTSKTKTLISLKIDRILSIRLIVHFYFFFNIL